MRKFRSPWKNVGYLFYRWFVPPASEMRYIPQIVIRYSRYVMDWYRYSRLPGAERMRVIDSCPCVHERDAATDVDSHYFYQDVWAFRKIVLSGATEHVDVGSLLDFVGCLTAVCSVVYVDIRVPRVKLDNLKVRKGSILALPYADASVRSLSSLHVAEHIGLGRYGDPLDSAGTQKACRELTRVLAPGGNLYFSLPVGKSRLCFNAHRIHIPQTILRYFDELQLVEFSGVDDEGHFMGSIDPDALAQSDYACGMFHFRKKETA